MITNVNSREKLKGLYAITDDKLAGGQLPRQVEEAVTGGASVVQYRSKTGDRESHLEILRELLPICHQAGALLIINDDTSLALESGADGVHLGRDDGDVAFAREQLGDKAVIGVSCYNLFEKALEAEREGADYAAFGRFFPSSTKPHAIQAAPELLTRARRELGIPTVAIGGITPENGSLLIDAGADMLAVIHGIFGQADIDSACRSFTQLFNNQRETHDDDPQ